MDKKSEYSLQASQIVDSTFRKIDRRYRPDWISDMQYIHNPILQPWQQLLMLHNLRKHPHIGMAPWERDRTPKFYSFSSDKAYIIAHSYPLIAFILWTMLASLALIFVDANNWLWWTYVCLVGIPFVIRAFGCLRQFIAVIRVKLFVGYVMEGVHAIVVDGKVGSGKTSSLLENYAILAKMQWQKICSAASRLLPFLDDIPYWRADLKRAAQEILETYFFFQESGTVPLLYTSVPAKVDGLFTNKLTADHLLQKERLPYGAVIIIDESSLVLPQKLYQTTPFNLIEFFKFLRHYGDFYVGATEQDEKSNLIYLRRACGKIVHVIKQEHVQKLRLLEWLYNLLDKWTEKHSSARRSAFLHKLEKIVNNSGFRKYYYKEYYEGDEEHPKVKSFIVKPSLDIIYASRAFVNGYRCKYKPLKPSKWLSLYLTEAELKEVFSDELKEQSKSKAQRQEEGRKKRFEKQNKNQEEKAA